MENDAALLNPEMGKLLRTMASDASYSKAKCVEATEHACRNIMRLKKSLKGSTAEAAADVDGGDSRYEAALSTLVTELERRQVGSEQIKSTLWGFGFTDDVALAMANEIVKHSEEIQELFSSTKPSLPHLVDIKWKLNYEVLNKEVGSVRLPSYVVTFILSENGVIREEEFLCSEQEMESLLAHFEDIEAATLKLAGVSKARGHAASAAKKAKASSKK